MQTNKGSSATTVLVAVVIVVIIALAYYFGYVKKGVDEQNQEQTPTEINVQI